MTLKVALPGLEIEPPVTVSFGVGTVVGQITLGFKILIERGTGSGLVLKISKIVDQGVFASVIEAAVTGVMVTGPVAFVVTYRIE